MSTSGGTQGVANGLAAATAMTMQTYTNPYGGTMRVAVFPADNAGLAFAVQGDAFPRMLMPSDATDGIFYIGDGTYDPVSGPEISVGNLGLAGYLQFFAKAGAKILFGSNVDANSKTIVNLSSINAGGGPLAVSSIGSSDRSVATLAPVSGTAFQPSAGSDVSLVVPVTFNPTAIATATCKVEISADNITFSTLVTKTLPTLATLAGTIDEVAISVPAAWWVKLTTINAVLGTATFY